MLAFATSFRARSLAGDKWDYHVWLLERVVESMLAQAGGDSEVVIACHDVPDSRIAGNSRVHFLPVGVEPPAKTFDDMVADKVLKLSAAARWTQQHGFEYVAFNDADDLVSNRIGAFVHANREGNGWYSTSQFFYTYGGRLMRHQQIAGRAAGPCVIVRTDLLNFAVPPFHGEWVDTVARGGEQHYLSLLSRHNVEVNILAAVGIGYYRDYMEQQATTLAPLPFAANVVINHKGSMSTTGGTHGYPVISSLGSLRRSLRWLPTLRPVSASVRREFSIPAISEIPSDYLGGASIFWR